GGSRAFDPSVYELTHRPEENQNLWNILFREGQISALERCALDFGRRVQFLGVEDEAAYRANLCAAQKVYSKQALAEEILQRVDGMLKKSRGHFPRPVRKILNLSSDFDGGNLNVYSYAQGVVQVARKTLGLAPANVLHQNQWPQICRLFHLEKLKARLARFSGQAQKELEQVRRISAGSPVDFVWDVSRHPKTRGSLRRYFERMADELATRGVRVNDFGHLGDWIGVRILADELEARELLRELERLKAHILAHLAGTAGERAQVLIEFHWNVFKKICRLQAGREELKQISSSERIIFRWLSKQRFPQTQKLVSLFQSARDHYQWVGARDQILVQNSMSAIRRLGAKKTVILTGGFHTEAFTRRLAKEQIDFVVLSPVMTGSDRTLDYAGRIQMSVSHQLALAVAGAVTGDLRVNEMMRLQRRVAQIREAMSRRLAHGHSLGEQGIHNDQRIRQAHRLIQEGEGKKEGRELEGAERLLRESAEEVLSRPAFPGTAIEMGYIISGYNRLAACFFQSGNIGKAEEMTVYARRLFDEEKFRGWSQVAGQASYIMADYTRLINRWVELKNFHKAEEALSQARSLVNTLELRRQPGMRLQIGHMISAHIDFVSQSMRSGNIKKAQEMAACARALFDDTEFQQWSSVRGEVRYMISVSTRLGHCLIASEQLAEAEALFDWARQWLEREEFRVRKAIQKEAGYVVSGYLNLARRLKQNGELEKAQRLLSQVLPLLEDPGFLQWPAIQEELPFFIGIHNSLAHLWIGLKNCEKAEELAGLSRNFVEHKAFLQFSNVRKQMAYIAGIYNKLMRVYTEGNRLEDAARIEELIWSLLQNPGFHREPENDESLKFIVPEYVRLAHQYIESENFEKAEAILLRAKSIVKGPVFRRLSGADPRMRPHVQYIIREYNRLLQMYTTAGGLEKAERIMRGVRDLLNDSEFRLWPDVQNQFRFVIPLFCGLAHQYLQTGQWDKAEEVLGYAHAFVEDEAFRRDPEAGPLAGSVIVEYTHLADPLIRSGQLEKAGKFLNDACRLIQDKEFRRARKVQWQMEYVIGGLTFLSKQWILSGELTKAEETLGQVRIFVEDAELRRWHNVRAQAEFLITTYTRLVNAYIRSDAFDKSEEILAVMRGLAEDAEFRQQPEVQAQMEFIISASVNLANAYFHFSPLRAAAEMWIRTYRLFTQYMACTPGVSGEARYLAEAFNRWMQRETWSELFEDAVWEEMMQCAQDLFSTYALLIPAEAQRRFTNFSDQLSERRPQAAQEIVSRVQSEEAERKAEPAVLLEAALPIDSNVSAHAHSKPVKRAAGRNGKQPHAVSVDERMKNLRRALEAQNGTAIKALLEILLPKARKAKAKGNPFSQDYRKLLAKAQHYITQSGSSDRRGHAGSLGVSQQAVEDVAACAAGVFSGQFAAENPGLLRPAQNSLFPRPAILKRPNKLILQAA
ncbi:MAG: hypothetical protein HY586_03225, partial [Candidatus Omnitrophica bacterium]|nr:hypothetical protein [Candidatus Omnitrophota bacterium]